MLPGMEPMSNQARAIFYFIIFTGTFTLLYASTFMSLFHTWSTNEDYSHGFLIIPVSLYLLWMKKDELFRQKLMPSNWGFLLIFLWAVLYFIGNAGSISAFTSYSMIVFLMGVIIAATGFHIGKMVLFPVLFLIFMIPIPSEIYTMLTTPLKLLATTASVAVLRIFDIPVVQEGNLVHLPNYSLQVVVACSGIRSLISIVALGLLIGYILFSSIGKRIALFLFSLPVSLFGNIFRISATGMLAYYISPEMAEGFSHTLAGLVTFALSFIILLAGARFIQWTAATSE